MLKVQSLLEAPAASLAERRGAVNEAINACEEALARVRPEERHARRTVWFNLGVCMRARVEEDRSGDAERAIECFATALTLCDRDREPEEWARTKNALGIAYHERARGERATNLRTAARELQDALQVRRTLGDGDYTAASLANLANVHVSVRGPEREENIERAIAEYDEALVLLSPENTETRAAILVNLATALLERPGAQRGENIDRAITACEEAMQLGLGEREHHTAKLITANALGLRTEGVKAENLERAIALAEEVLTYREAHESRERQAAAHNSRGVLYARRIKGGRADNVEQAIHSYRRALEVYQADAHPMDRAGTLNNLATVLRARMLGDPETNEDEAVNALLEALEIFDRPTNPYHWAGTIANLGTAYFDRTTGDRSGHIENAIAAYRSALEVRTETRLPWEWAATQFNLGQALWRRHAGDRAANLNDGADALEATLRVRDRAGSPDGWAATTSMLAVIYDELSELGLREPADAINRYEEALEVYRPETFPAEARANANNLGSLLLRIDEPERALVVARAGLDAAEALYGAAPTEEGREHELDDNARLYRLAAEAAVLAGRNDSEVFELSEAARGRLLGDWLMSTRAAPAPDDALLGREYTVQSELRAALLDARRLIGTPERQLAVARAAQARHELAEVWAEISSDPRAGVRLTQRTAAEQLQAWLNALPGQPAVIVLSALSDRPLAFIAEAERDGPKVVNYMVGNTRVDKYLGLLHEQVLAAERPVRNETWREIGELLIEPALAQLERTPDLLYIVPLGGLHAVPWHASLVDGTPLIERFPIAYAPSVAAALTLAKASEPAARPGGRTTVVGDPDGSLRHARAEAEFVAKLANVQPVIGADATVQAVLAGLNSADWAHVAAHGRYDPADPLASGIELSDGTLEARELISSNAPEVIVLSSCETGRQLARAGDELWGLARALLYAGSRSAVLSLWRVGDRVTAKLMRRFYEELAAAPQSGSPALALALRQAMLRTREEQESTSMWAPFMVFGNPY